MSREDPNWPRASSWLASGSNVEAGHTLAVLGVPMNNSVLPARCDLAPGAIRQALARYTLYDPETGVDVAAVAVHDFGDVALAGASPEEGFFRATQAIKRACGNAAGLVLLGGDHTITQVGLHALGLPLPRCGLLIFDAHHDVRDLGSGLTNGKPIQGLLREGLPGTNVVQIGLQSFTNSPHYARTAWQAGVTAITADEVHLQGIDAVVTTALEMLTQKTDVIYVDLDLDVLDRAFAPACLGSRPGGLFPWMLRRAARLCGVHPSVRVLDIVEIDPSKDIAEATSLAAASFLLAFASGLAQRKKQ